MNPISAGDIIWLAFGRAERPLRHRATRFLISTLHSFDRPVISAVVLTAEEACITRSGRRALPQLSPTRIARRFLGEVQSPVKHAGPRGCSYIRSEFHTEGLQPGPCNSIALAAVMASPGVLVMPTPKFAAVGALTSDHQIKCLIHIKDQLRSVLGRCR